LRLSTLSSAEIAMLQSAMKATGATSWMTPKATPLLPALKAANNPAGTVPTHLEAGRLYEASRLLQMGQPKNTMVWRPTLADIDSATFKVVVGDPRYTPGGQLRGTIYDATEMSLLELKSGSSPLGSNYQLRLQTYGALKAGRPYIIETTRPINSRFAAWLKRWGVEVRAPGD